MDLNSEDRLVSCDVEALFPSIPVEKLMKYLDKWIKAFKKRGLKTTLN
jgi:hypothetical protein